jgi:hypothetical protein
MPGIFISYRREDSIAYAGRVYDHLVSRFGKNHVFMDVDAIEPGLDFVDVLHHTVASCDAVVVVIGKNWLTATDERGRRRLDDPEDLVRVELAAALDRKIRVIPVLVGGARMPVSQELPGPLMSLSRRNALEISDLAFHQNVTKLIAVLERAIAPRETAPAPQPERPAEARVEDHRAAEPSSPSTVGQPGSAAKPISVPPLPLSARPVPLWRRFLLLYALRSIGGWILRLVFYLSAFMSSAGVGACMTGDFRRSADSVVLVSFISVAVLSWFGATWLGKRAVTRRRKSSATPP